MYRDHFGTLPFQVELMYANSISGVFATTVLFSTVAAAFYILTNDAQDLHFSHILTLVIICLFTLASTTL
jgi:hypothetical protein